MKLIIFLAFTLLVNYTFSQDIITKNNGEEIETKIIEIGIENIKYKKYNYLDGPTYVISKVDITKIKYENGSEDFFNEIETIKINDTTKYQLRTGQHLGLHVTPGGVPSTFGIGIENAKGGIKLGIDYFAYFNHYLGLKTGLSSAYIQTSNSNFQSLVGIPLKFVYTTGNKLGFYTEIGPTFYIPISPNWGSSNFDYYTEIINSFSYGTVAFEPVLGINYNYSNRLNLNTGLSIHIFGNSNTPISLVGLQIAATYKLKKKVKK